MAGGRKSRHDGSRPPKPQLPTVRQDWTIYPNRTSSCLITPPITLIFFTFLPFFVSQNTDTTPPQYRPCQLRRVRAETPPTPTARHAEFTASLARRGNRGQSRDGGAAPSPAPRLIAGCLEMHGPCLVAAAAAAAAGPNGPRGTDGAGQDEPGRPERLRATGEVWKQYKTTRDVLKLIEIGRSDAGRCIKPQKVLNLLVIVQTIWARTTQCNETSIRWKQFTEL